MDRDKTFNLRNTLIDFWEEHCDIPCRKCSDYPCEVSALVEHLTYELEDQVEEFRY